MPSEGANMNGRSEKVGVVYISSKQIKAGCLF